MSNNEIGSITAQQIRKTLIDFLKQRLINNSNYKSALNRLAKAETEQDFSAINQAKQTIIELEQRFELQNWLEDALERRLAWITIASHIAKGIHSSSKGDNVNYASQLPPSEQNFVSSATVELPYDCSGNAGALDIFSLLKQKVNQNISVLQLLTDHHPAMALALSDDPLKSARYLRNLNTLVNDNWQQPQSSALNKQIYWPNAQQPYLSASDQQYHILMPLHPSSLCHVVYQKIQQRFAEVNKSARKEQRAYFTLPNLAVTQLGGSNPQGVSQLVSSQGGRNFLLPALPPQINRDRGLTITRQQTTIFADRLKYRCRHGFSELFAVVAASDSTKSIRDKRKQQALGYILGQLLQNAQQIQQQLTAGWSKAYQLDMYQKYWLDPGRANLEGEDDFAYGRAHIDWIVELARQFSRWINTILQKEFTHIATHFDDVEMAEWQREFLAAIKASQRQQREIS